MHCIKMHEINILTWYHWIILDPGTLKRTAPKYRKTVFQLMQLFISFAARISPLKIREVSELKISSLTSEIGVLPEYKNRSEEELESLEDINVTRDKMLVEAQLKQVCPNEFLNK